MGIDVAVFIQVSIFLKVDGIMQTDNVFKHVLSVVLVIVTIAIEVIQSSHVFHRNVFLAIDGPDNVSGQRNSHRVFIVGIGYSDISFSIRN